MRITVILLAWRDAAAARAQLLRLGAWKKIEPALCLVDNGGHGDSTPALDSFNHAAGYFYVRPGKNMGYAAGINAGIRAAGAGNADAILLLNNDAELEESDALALLGHLGRHPEVGIMGPVLEETRGGRKNRSFGGRNPLWHVDSRRRKPPAPGEGPLIETPYVPGTAFLFRSRLVYTVGLLDEDFFFSGEIAEYCMRARNAGWRCAVAADAVARHTQNGDDGLRQTLYRYYSLRNRFLLARRCAPASWKLAAAAWTLLGVLMCVKSGAAGGAAPAKAVIWAMRDGWAGRFGNRNELFNV